jgi:Tol biopolymer transport system component
MAGRAVLMLVALAACDARLAGAPADAADLTGPDAPLEIGADAAPDAPVMLGAWGAPSAIPGASTSAAEDDCTLSSDKLELYFKRNDSGTNNLYVMTRASTTAAWSAPVALTALNTSSQEESPRLSTDDLTLYFGRGGNIFRTTRTAIGQPWGVPQAVGAVNTGAYEKWLAVCSNGYAIVSRANGSNGQDLYEGTVSGGTPTLLTQLNSTSNEQGTFLTSDCLRVYFQSNRDGNHNMYVASRTSLTAAWTNPTKLVDFNTANFHDEDPWISADERVFVFASTRNGNKDLFIATR